ncbi:hypothetical protein COOONC_22812 [Cooperia oncophora]
MSDIFLFQIFESSMNQELEANQQRKRRKYTDDAERKSIQCENGNGQQGAECVEVNAKPQQRRREKGHCEEAGTVHKRHSTEDEEKRIARLEANARRQRLRRENETPEERAARLRANALRQRRRREQETMEERAARLQANAQRQQRLRMKAVSPAARSAKQENDLPSLPTLLPPEQNACIPHQQPPLPYPFTISCDPNIFACQQ